MYKINIRNVFERFLHPETLNIKESSKKASRISRKSEGTSHSEANFGETDYYFENGLRKVYPYSYTYVTTCKERWFGRTILDVYSNELGDLPIQEYAKRIENGYLTVNGEKVGIHHIVKHHDVFASTVHRHEMPVLATHVKIIGDSDDLIAVEKPPSVPVHPCGYYRHNSVLFMLAKELDLKGLYAIHRLDRLTSGVLLFARTKERAKQIQEEIEQRLVQKTYIARVEGDFPDETVHCDACVREIHGKIGLSIAGKKGKYCLTEFQKIRCDKGTSIVLCKPSTGRMHQIRVHLQYLGFPIVNDSLYNCNAFGPHKGKGGNYGKTVREVLEDVHRIAQTKKYESLTCDETSSLPNSNLQLEKFRFLLSETYEADASSLKYIKDPKRITRDDDCWNCRMGMREPVISELYICLHALEYKGTNWKFQSEMPAWASEAWIES